MYIWEQIQFEWISSKLEMGNPGLPDPRVAPRVSPSLLTFTPIHPLLVSLLLLPSPLRTHILLVSIHPLVRDPPLPSADLNDIFEGKFRRNRGKHFVLGGASLLPAFLPPSMYTAFLCFPSSAPPPLSWGRANRIRPTRRYTTPSLRAMPFAPVSIFEVEWGHGHLGAVVENVLRVDIAANRV